MNHKILLIIFAILILGGVVFYCSRNADEPVRATISPAEQLQADEEGYKRAEGPIEFSFPADHGPHPGFRTEWWYYTGNLVSEDGRRFGYQFTIFRNQVTPNDTKHVKPASGWTSDQLYMAHFAVSDLDNNKHYFEERVSRGALGLAGAKSPPFRIWLEDWVAEYAGEEHLDLHLNDGPDSANSIQVTEISDTANRYVTPMRIQATMEQAKIDLLLKPVKPLVLQGDGGYDKKGSDPGDASYYLTFTRMATSGTVEINNEPFEVKGNSWMDHEWSTSALSENQVGWDWFSIQLDNDYDVMFYQIRELDGSVSPYTTGTIVDPEGQSRTISFEDATLTELSHWTSPETGGNYPVSWNLEIPSENLTLKIETWFPAQEMNVSVLYYEGATRISGRHKGVEVSGKGYVEMTGYGD